MNTYRSPQGNTSAGFVAISTEAGPTIYLYSADEIRSLLQAALQMPYHDERAALLPWTYHCLFGLLSVTVLNDDY